jgi:hypothetical protein
LKASHFLDIPSHFAAMEKSQNVVDYKPLPLDGSEIRLVAIIPGENDAEVECVVSHHPFSEDGLKVVQYEALSYVWGEATVTAPIKLNGKSFQATKNLEAALRALRHRDAERLLWVDAICIDQSRTTERNREVRRMDHIYRNAVQTVIWLGRGTEEGNIRRPLEDIDSIPRKTHDLLNLLADADPEVPEDAANVLRRADSTRGLQLLFRFFTRPWFTRVWILQEIALAKTASIIYGDVMIPWDRIVQVLESLRRLKANANIRKVSAAARGQCVHRCRMQTISANHQENEEPAISHLEGLLWHTQYFVVTDPRDRLYGLLGMVKGLRDEKLLEIDYSKPVAEVFLDFSVFMLQKGTLSSILCSITQPLDGLPSWTSNWTASVDDLSSSGGPRASKVSDGMDMFMLYYKTHNIEQPSNPPRFSSDRHQVTLRGRIIDDFGIRHMAKRFDDDATKIERLGPDTIQIYRDRLIQWEDDMERQPYSRMFYTTQAERRQRWKEAVLQAIPSHACALSAVYDVLTDREQELHLSQTDALNAVIELAAQLGCNLEYRRPFVSELGTMGSTSANGEIRHGDVVCLFVGSLVPYILRPVKGSLGSISHCQFIGRCWVSGIVGVEAAKCERLGLWELQDITLV